MRRSKSTLFLMEQLIVIAVFSICAAACVKILTSSYYTAKDTRDIGNAILAAENGAECYKAGSGDVGKVAGILGGSLTGVNNRTAAVVYYDKDWVVCGESDAVYVMLIVEAPPESGSGGLACGELTVERLGDDAMMLIAFPVSVATGRGGV